MASFSSTATTSLSQRISSCSLMQPLLSALVATTVAGGSKPNGHPNFLLSLLPLAICIIYPIIMAAVLWGHERSKKITAIYSDNKAVVDILNKRQCCCQNIIQFMQRLTMVSAHHQFIMCLSHIPSHQNSVA